MLAFTISRSLVCKVGKMFKDMMKHEAHFIMNFMDDALSVLAMGAHVSSCDGGMDDGSGGGMACGFILHILCILEGDFFVIGQIVKLVKFFNDLFMGHDRGRLAMCSRVGSEGGLAHLRGKSSSEFKYGCGEDGGVVKISARGAWFGDDSLKEMSIMLVRATFLGGFLVEDEALEAILKVD
ncbi:hypothetical protein Tco_0073814 [Tanacetum coccineum]